MFQRLKKGSYVIVTNLCGVPEHIKSKIKIGDVLQVRKIKINGGILFENLILGYNRIGHEQGLLRFRVKLIDINNN